MRTVPRRSHATRERVGMTPGTTTVERPMPQALRSRQYPSEVRPQRYLAEKREAAADTIRRVTAMSSGPTAQVGASSRSGVAVGRGSEGGGNEHLGRPG